MVQFCTRWNFFFFFFSQAGSQLGWEAIFSFVIWEKNYGYRDRNPNTLHSILLMLVYVDAYPKLLPCCTVYISSFPVYIFKIGDLTSGTTGITVYSQGPEHYPAVSTVYGLIVFLEIYFSITISTIVVV